jgi:8-amino-3,8-dideoxy-alpha-D-manno-octulosonate transaminase
MDALGQVPGVSFARIPDPDGDSATFLNMLLPDTETAGRVVTELNVAGVGGFNYWFTNMYHFINQWDHIKEMRTASALPIEKFGAPQDYKNLDIPNAQAVIGRLISFGVRATWTPEEVAALASNIEAAVRKVVLVEA